MNTSSRLASLLWVVLLLSSCGSSESTECDPATDPAGCVKPLVCEGIKKDCNNDPKDGCETDTDRDVDNCGACGQRCPGGANATAACYLAKCFLSCLGTFLDCNKDSKDGCEVDSASDPAHCGSCYPCSGSGLTNDNVGCVNSRCTFTCRGDNFDINNNLEDGCEKLDNLGGGHDPASATRRSNIDCFDTSADSFNGGIFADARTHANPTLANFDAQIGAAPDYWVVRATGGAFCVNDYSVTFKTSGGSNTAGCFRLTFTTDKGAQMITQSGNESNTITGGSGSYSSDTDVSFLVEKLCPLTLPEIVTYTVSYHL